METNGTGILSFSLASLRRLQQSFDDLQGGRPIAAPVERLAHRLVAALGATARPLLIRELVGDDDDRRRWAHALLVGASDDGLRARLIADLEGIVLHDRPIAATDGGKVRALALMTELGVRPPEVATLHDPDGARDVSLGELAACLTTPAEIARATDLLLGELEALDLTGLVADLTAARPGAAARLIDELLVRDDLPEAARDELIDLRARAGGGASPIATHGRTRRRPNAALGRHADGRTILVVSARGDGKPARRRALCALLAPDGRLIDGHHADDLPLGGLDRAIVAPLVDRGFAFGPLGLDAARGCLIQAARSALIGGLRLPRDFYLGRDLLGLRDEHLDGTGRRAEAAEIGALAARAADYLRDGEPARARPLLERYVAEAPGDPDGHAHLGLCLLGLGDATAARQHLGRAVFLCPDEPLYQWNLAAAAHRADDLGACHQALAAYLRGRDVAPAADARREHALRFVIEFERLRALAHPTAPPRRRAKRATRRRSTTPRR